LNAVSRITPEGRLDLRCWCGAIGAFGEGVKLHKGELGKWYCRPHVPPGFLPARSPPRPPAPAVPTFTTDRAIPDQWRLL
jgi:hypothetical protein